MITKVLRRLMDEYDMGVADVAVKANLPVETVRNFAYEGRVQDPKISSVKAIADVFHVSVNYMLGEPFLAPDEVEIVGNYRKCGRHGKSRISLVSKHEARAAKKEKEANEKRDIPCLIPKKRVKDGFVHDGCGTTYIKTSNPDAFAAIEVTNNSYAPIHCKGDQVLLEYRYPEHGEIAVFVRDGIGFARTYIEEGGKYILRCVVGNKEDIILKRMDEIECIGTCIDVIRV